MHRPPFRTGVGAPQQCPLESIASYLWHFVLTSNIPMTPNMTGLYYMAPAGAICILALMVVYELRPMLDNGAFWTIHNNPAHFLGASALGFILNILSFMILKESSAVLLKGISVLRTAALVLFCVTFLGEEVTMRQFVGYIVSLLCFVWYNALRMDATRDVTETPVKRKASSSTRENAYV